MVQFAEPAVLKKPPIDGAVFSEEGKLPLPEHVRNYFVEQGAKGGKIGGKLGGIARAEALTKRRRVAIAKKAAKARWAKKKSAKARTTD